MEIIDAKALVVGAKTRYMDNDHVEMREAFDIAIDALLKQISKSPIYKQECVYLCPPDCGGAEFDEYEEVPHCPSCSKIFDRFPKDNYCKNCGQKLKWD